MKCSLNSFNFLEGISSLSHSIVFLYFSLQCSLKKAFLSLLAIFWNSAFSWLYLSLSTSPFTSLLFSAICTASSDNHFAVFLFFCPLVWFWSPPPVQGYKPLFIVLQVLYLPDLKVWKWKLLSHVQLFVTPRSLPGSSVHRILQARILGWVTIPFSRGSSQPRDRTQVSHISDRFLTSWAYYIFCKWKLTGGIILMPQKCANGK